MSETAKLYGSRPSIVFKEYEQYAWKIRIQPYERLNITVELSQIDNKSRIHLLIAEGPSQYAEELRIYSGYLYSANGSLTRSTKTFQGFIVLTVKREVHFSHIMSL